MKPVLAPCRLCPIHSTAVPNGLLSSECCLYRDNPCGYSAQGASYTISEGPASDVNLSMFIITSSSRQTCLRPSSKSRSHTSVCSPPTCTLQRVQIVVVVARVQIKTHEHVHIRINFFGFKLKIKCAEGAPQQAESSGPGKSHGLGEVNTGPLRGPDKL